MHHSAKNGDVQDLAPIRVVSLAYSWRNQVCERPNIGRPT